MVAKIRCWRRSCEWYIDAEQAGTYKLELRRWPVEEDKPMNWGDETTAGMNAVYESDRSQGKKPLARKKGKKLKIDIVRLTAGEGFDRTKDVKADDKSISFNVTLPKGETKMQTWMINKDKPEENRGAYYVYISKVK